MNDSFFRLQGFPFFQNFQIIFTELVCNLIGYYFIIGFASNFLVTDPEQLLKTGIYQDIFTVSVLNIYNVGSVFKNVGNFSCAYTYLFFQVHGIIRKFLLRLSESLFVPVPFSNINGHGKCPDNFTFFITVSNG